MNEYKSDIKIVLFVICGVIIAILLNLDYLFSDNTINQITVVEKSQLTKTDSLKFGEK